MWIHRRTTDFIHTMEWWYFCIACVSFYVKWILERGGKKNSHRRARSKRNWISIKIKYKIMLYTKVVLILCTHTVAHSQLMNRKEEKKTLNHTHTHSFTKETFVYIHSAIDLFLQIFFLIFHSVSPSSIFLAVRIAPNAHCKLTNVYVTNVYVKERHFTYGRIFLLANLFSTRYKVMGKEKTSQKCTINKSKYGHIVWKIENKMHFYCVCFVCNWFIIATLFIRFFVVQCEKEKLKVFFFFSWTHTLTRTRETRRQESLLIRDQLHLRGCHF